MKKKFLAVTCMALASMFALGSCNLGGGKDSGSKGEEGGNVLAATPLAGFDESLMPATDLIEKKQGQIDVVLVFEDTLSGWQALANEYQRIHKDAVVVKLNATYTEASSYSQNLNNQVNSKEGEWDIVQGNLFLGGSLQTHCIDMNTAVLGKNAYAGAEDGVARTWKSVLTEDAYQSDKSGASNQTYIMNSEGLQTAWFVNDVARDAAITAGYTGSETPANWDELMSLCYYMQQAGYENPLGIALDKDSISASQFTWLLRVYGDYYYRNEYANIMLSNTYEYDQTATNPEADMEYGVSANKFFYSIFEEGTSYVGVFSDKYQEFIEQLLKMKPYLRPSAASAEESGLKALRSEFGTQSKGKKSPQVLLDYAGAGLAFLQSQNADFQLDFFDYPAMVSDYIPKGTVLRDVGGNGGYLSIVKREATQDALNLDFMKFVMSPYGQSLYYSALKAAGSVPMGMTTVKNNLVVVPEEWKTFFQTEKISFNGLVDSNPYISHLIRGFSKGENTAATLITNWQKYLTGTGTDAMDTNAFCLAWEAAMELDWKDYCATYGKDESLRTNPDGGVAL